VVEAAPKFSLFSHVLFLQASNAVPDALTPFGTLLPDFVPVRVGAGVSDDALKRKHMLI